MMLKVGFNKHYLVIAMLLCGLLAKAQSSPSFTSTPVTNGTYGTAYLYSITTEDAESNPRTISYSGVLPAGLSLNDNGDGTASIAGTAIETGSFSIILTVDDNIDGTNAQPFTITIAKASAGVTLGSLTTIYNSSAQSITAITSPAGLAVTFTYNGSTTAPTNADSYAVVATINDINYEGNASGTFVITKATATIALSGLSTIYNGSGQAATSTTTPSGLTVNTTYNGSSALPVNAGSYTVVATINDVNYDGTSSGTLVIGKATASVALSGLSTIYNGSAQTATAITTPAGLTVNTTYNGSAALPVNAGSYTVAATISDANYDGNASGTLVIGKATATVALSGLTKIYNSSAQTATAITTPLGLTVNTTYNGSAALPVNAGTYTVAATINDANYDGDASGTLVIGKATATVALSGLTKTYNASAQTATATTTPAGLTVNTTYNGSAALPVNAESYSVVATINDANYDGTSSGTLVIGKATATVALSGLTKTYNGSAQTATAITTPAGLIVNTTYNGSAALPINAGSYSVVATINDVNYDGNASGTLVIGKATATVALSGLTKTYNASAQAATAITTPAGLTVNTTYNGSAALPINAGSYSVAATINDANYDGNASGTLVIGKATATVTLSGLTKTYNGSAQIATAITTPAGLTVNTTYNGSAALPINAGSYSVAATINDANYDGNASGTLVIGKATATVALSGLTKTYNASTQTVTVITTPAGLTVNTTYNGSAATPVNAGSYTVAATINDANYDGNASGTLVIGKATASVSLSGLSAIYNGSGRAATVTTTPAGLTVNTTYNGSAALPVNAGSYTVVSTINEANYSGNTTGTLVISKATPTINWNAPTAITYETPLGTTQLNATSSITGTFTYNPASGTVLTAGANKTLSVNFTPTDATNYNPVNNTQTQITVNKATPNVIWPAPSPITYGTPLSATQLNATATNASAVTVPGAFIYSPASTNVLSAGSQTIYLISFTPNDAANYNSVTNISRTLIVNKATPVITWADPLPIRINVPISGTQLNATSSVPGTFVYNPANGSFSTNGTRTLSVSFTPNDAANYNSVPTTQVQITVSDKDNPVITWPTPDAISYGTLLSAAQLNATANIAGTFTYTPAIGTLLTAGANKNLKVDFIPNDGVNYNDISKTVQINIDPAVLTITVPNKSREYGAANPSFPIMDSDYSGFVNNETESVLDTPPTVTCQAIASDIAGSVFPIIPFGGVDDNYSFNYLNGTLTIDKANPIITWDSPVNINYGTALSGVQLNAASTIDGTLTYNPTIGTVLNAGSQNIKAIFIPTDETNYNTVIKNQTLTVNKIPINVKAENITTTYGTKPSFTPGYNLTDFVNGDTPSVIDTPPILTTTAAALPLVGSYPISISGGSDNNYTFTGYTSGTLTINKAPLTVTANNTTRLFNTANPPITFSYSGFVNNETAAVINVAPVATTSVIASSPGGSYPITVSGGSDDSYDFTYVNGTLTVIVNNPPLLKNIQVSLNEDTRFNFTYDLFSQNITDDPGSQIAFIKITSLPVNGTLSWKGNKVSINNEITSNNSSLEDFTYQPNTDYNGSDAFNWNSSDGTFLSGSPAIVSIKINPVNDSPVLSNIESDAIKYSLGDKGIAITQKLTVNDIDNNFMHSAKITITENYSSGDNLAASTAMSAKIVASFNTSTGELSLKGKDTKSNYETALSGILFSSAVTGTATISNKIITITVNDSTANSNIVSRTVEITEVFPELDIVNSFTPNNDGVNDQWDIINLNLYSKIKIAIVNQEGINVFSCTTQNCKWDGRSGGNELPSGSYFYTIDLNDGKRKYQGTVTILK